MDRIRLIENRCKGEGCDLSAFGPEQKDQVRAFHASFPEYAPTPLVRLEDLAGRLGVDGICIKDESYRFGLNAFKVLGGSYAIGQLLARRLGKSISDAGYPVLTGREAEKALEGLTFITATDGNHGRGVAWTAAKLGCRSIVYMPAGTAPERLENIRKLGSDASITDLVYDDAVRKAASDAQKNNWILVQDTSLPGYEEIPKLIMQGYMTMGSEALEQMGGVLPTHVFLQAGVGSMAAAVAATLAVLCGENRPKIIIVEPHSADCVFRTGLANDGQLHAAEGEMRTIMAGLACGEVCAPAWEILKELADFFITISDDVAAEGMRKLAAPEGDDRKVVSGESGASTFGSVLALLTDASLAPLRDQIGLDSRSVILCFSTEGATDKENYRKIVGRDSI